MSDTENNENENAQAPAEPKTVMDLGAALNELDHGNAEHWEKNGILSKAIYPSLAILTELTGREITREEVQNFAPDFVREEAPEAPLASPEGKTVAIVDGDAAHEEGELATLHEGADPIAMLDAAFNAASSDFVRFHPSFGQVLQQYQAMLPSIKEEASRNKTRGRKFGA